MLTTEYRPMTAEERAVLEPRDNLARQGQFAALLYYMRSAAIGMFYGMMISGLIGALLEAAYTSEAILPTFLGIGIGIGLLVGVRQAWQEKKEAQRWERILDNNQMEVLHCTASDAVELLEVDDEGPGYFLDVGDGRALFLQGQYLFEFQSEDEETEGDTFPCREFDVVRLHNSDWTFRLVCRGESLPPSRTIEPEVLADLADRPQDGDVLNVSLTTLEEDLKRLYGTK